MFWGEPLREHLESFKGYEDFIHTFASVDVMRLEEPDFAAYADDLLKQFKAMGVRGLKLWKNIGCTLKDSSGAYIRPDDSRLRPIWDSAAKYGLIVLFHIADPVSFFTPVDKNNEFYESLCENPDWSFYDRGGEGRHTFEDLMQQQDNLLAQNPDTTFIIPHVGSCAENLAWVGEQLDKHSNMYIDTAARNNLLGRQPYTARDFFIKHQDRILFGTDYFAIPGSSEKDTRDFYADHYRFFETYDEYFRAYRNWGLGQGRWNIYGLGLPDEVLKKFYAENAIKLLKV
jgi:predicted TIM-barrel fold metal-dependent hydrolase